MAGNTAVTKDVSFDELTKKASEISGQTQKDIKSAIGATDKAIKQVIAENRPKKVGDKLTIDAVLTGIVVERKPEVVSGNKVLGEHYAIGQHTQKAYLRIANDGLEIKAKPVEQKKPEKTSKAG